jgi:hypothetical protein
MSEMGDFLAATMPRLIEAELPFSAPPQPYMLRVTTVVRHEDGGE